MFHVIEKERAWRTTNGISKGFDALEKTKPVVAIGANKPLGRTTLMADYYRWWISFPKRFNAVTLKGRRWC